MGVAVGECQENDKLHSLEVVTLMLSENHVNEKNWTLIARYWGAAERSDSEASFMILMTQSLIEASNK